MTKPKSVLPAHRHLQKDPVMKTLIKQHGPIPELTPSENLFADLVETIVNQQLSEKAGATIFKRFNGLFGEHQFPKPKHILSIPLVFQMRRYARQDYRGPKSSTSKGCPK